MNSLKKIWMALGIILIVASLTEAGISENAGTTSAQFLKLGVGARALAMGGAFTAVADDVSSIWWNPAGLSELDCVQAHFMYASLVESIYFSNLSVGFPLRKFEMFTGMSVSILGLGEGIPLLEESGGDMVETQKSFSASFSTFTFSLAEASVSEALSSS